MNEINFKTIWIALDGYRENCIPMGQDPEYDEEWNEILEQMALIEKELNK
jgi:hypothetical protein